MISFFFYLIFGNTKVQQLGIHQDVIKKIFITWVKSNQFLYLA